MTKKKTSKKYHCEHKAKSNSGGKTTITVSAKSLLSFIEAVGVITNDARVHITNGLRVFMVDCANVCMLDAELECHVSHSNNIIDTFGMDISSMKKLLSKSKGHTVTLEITDTDITVSYGRFSGKCCGIDTAFLKKDPQKEPDINLNTHFDMPGSYLYETASVFGKSGKILFETEDKVIYIKTFCGDVGFKEVVGTIGDKNKERLRSMFSGDYIYDIAKVVKDAPVHVDAGIDHPCIISTKKDDCNIRFLLAPRIEAD